MTELCKKKTGLKILAVETSCDETAVAIVENGRRTLSGVLLSQIDRHALFGGVVPEIASRMHVEAIDPLVDEALERARLSPAKLDAVAVTYGPGLVGALLTGVSWAKAYAYALKLPLVPVHHIEGHISANYLSHPSLEPPFTCLVASGGHSHLINVEGYGHYKLKGQTLDDAAGEAFDKVARVLSLPYPGGPRLDRLAEEGDPDAFRFPKPKMEGTFDFSFSGLKTCAANMLNTLAQQGVSVNRADFAASFRAAIVRELAHKAVRCAKGTPEKKLAIAGGVAANALLRRELTRLCSQEGVKLYMPPLALCTDNAEMIASAAYYALKSGITSPLELNARPVLPLPV